MGKNALTEYNGFVSGSCDKSCDMVWRFLGRDMRPIQIWLPSFTASLAAPAIERDMQRAFREWRGEHTVWFLPEIKKPYRWKESQNPFDWTLAIPAECLEAVNVCHINDRGYVWEGHSAQRFPAGPLDGLLAT